MDFSIVAAVAVSLLDKTVVAASIKLNTTTTAAGIGSSSMLAFATRHPIQMDLKVFVITAE